MSLLKIVGESGNGIIVAGQLWAGVFILWAITRGTKDERCFAFVYAHSSTESANGIIGAG